MLDPFCNIGLHSDGIRLELVGFLPWDLDADGWMGDLS